MLIGITGTDGAGKGIVVKYLVEQKGFSHYSSRSFILKYIEKEGLPTTRNQMRLTANELRKKYGNAFVVQQAYEKAKENNEKNIVIESLRAVAEGEYLKEKEGILLAVDADQGLRYERVKQRRSESDNVSFDEFISHEKLEINDPNPHGMQKAKVMEMADYTIFNNGSIEELYLKLEEILKSN